MGLYAYPCLHSPYISLFLCDLSNLHPHVAGITTGKKGRPVHFVVEVSVATLSKESYGSILLLFFVYISSVQYASIVSCNICIILRAFQSSLHLGAVDSHSVQGKDLFAGIHIFHGEEEAFSSTLLVYKPRSAYLGAFSSIGRSMALDGRCRA